MLSAAVIPTFDRYGVASSSSVLSLAIWATSSSSGVLSLAIWAISSWDVIFFFYVERKNSDVMSSFRFLRQTKP